jgi:hypothetical protein
MNVATAINDWINDRLESVFVSYTLSKRIENEIEYQLEIDIVLCYSLFFLKLVFLLFFSYIQSVALLSILK